MKIFANDPRLPYRSTTISPIVSKAHIDDILSKYGITKTFWNWDLERNIVELGFQLSETFRGIDIDQLIRMKPPTIWKRHRRGKPESIDWKLSMRVFH